MADLWLQHIAPDVAPSAVLAHEGNSARRVDSIAFTLEWEKGCANPPALLKEAAKPEKLKQI
jgi:hypothetical protein